MCLGAKGYIGGRKSDDSFEKELNLPLPEMTFGNNSLVLEYDTESSGSSSNSTTSSLPSAATAQPSASATSALSSGAESASGQAPPRAKLRLEWNTMESLAGVATGEGWEERVGGGVKVSMADTWGKNRSTPSALLSDTPLPSKPVKPHDWTYSTCYRGSAGGAGGAEVCLDLFHLLYPYVLWHH